MAHLMVILLGVVIVVGFLVLILDAVDKFLAMLFASGPLGPIFGMALLVMLFAFLFAALPPM